MIPAEYFLNFSIDKKPELIHEFIFKPLFESCIALKDIPDIRYSNENKITRKIYSYLKYHSSISKAIQKHIIVVIYRAKEVNGDIETEPDLQFILPGRFKIVFEAKRIYRKDSCSEYCGENGVGRFLSGYYSPEDIDGGMIAYVQKGKIHRVRAKIIKIIKQKDCINLNRTITKNSIFISLHKRKANDDVKIHHMFFNFT